MIEYKRGAALQVMTDDRKEWESQFRTLDKLPGLSHIEVWLEHIPDADGAAFLKSLLAGTQSIIHAPFIHLSLVSHVATLNELSRRRCGDTIDFASLIGAKVVTLHAGTYPMFETQQTAAERLARTIQDFIALESPAVTVENMPLKSGTALECLGRLDDLRSLKFLLPNVCFTLDIGHSIQNGDDYLSFIAEQHRSIKNIHLHDGVFRGRGHLRLGQGSLDLISFVRSLHDAGYKEYVSLETISAEDTMASWYAWLKAENMAVLHPTEKS